MFRALALRLSPILAILSHRRSTTVSLETYPFIQVTIVILNSTLERVGKIVVLYSAHGEHFIKKILSEDN